MYTLCFVLGLVWSDLGLTLYTHHSQSHTSIMFVRATIALVVENMGHVPTRSQHWFIFLSFDGYCLNLQPPQTYIFTITNKQLMFI